MARDLLLIDEAVVRVTLAQIGSWCDGVAVSPDEILKRRRVKAMIEV
jgi:hypothetical protein